MQYFKKTYEDIFGQHEAIMAITEDGHVLGIPADPANTDYQRYLAWIDEGNEPEPFEEPVDEEVE